MTKPRNVVIEHNTLYDSRAGRECLRLTQAAANENWVVSNNALYCPNGPTLVNSGGDLSGAYFSLLNALISNTYDSCHHYQ